MRVQPYSDSHKATRWAILYFAFSGVIAWGFGCGGFVPIEGPPAAPQSFVIASADPSSPANPAFERVTKYQGMTLPTGAEVDVYMPDEAAGSLPIALLLQGFNVSKPNYQRFASTLAGYGFVVVVPQFYGLLGLGLGAELEEIPATLQFARTENANPASPLFDRIDAGRMVLLGHSYGGGAALNAAAGRCVPPYCLGVFDRPAELLGVAVYGADLRAFVLGGPIPRIDNSLPVAIIRGELDGIAPPSDAGRTFDHIQNGTRALITVSGANHFGMTDVVSPIGIISDPSPPTISQAVAVDTVAQFSALFLKAFALGEPEAAALMLELAAGDSENTSPATNVEVVLILDSDDSQ